MVSRRGFFCAAGAILGGGLTPAIGRAAAAGTSRVYDSPLDIRKIAWGLALGIGKEVWLAVQRLDPQRVETFVKSLDSEGFLANVETLRERIPLRFDQPELLVNDQPQPEKILEHVQALHAIAKQDPNFDISPAEAEKLLGRLQLAKQDLLDAIEAGASVRLNYNVHYRDTAHFRISNFARKGQVQIKLKLLQPVRNVSGAEFVADLENLGEGTRATTSLWTDVCIGRREGPLVRRIAHREITCRQAKFLAEVQHEVQTLYWHPGESRLSQMLPELIRRIAEA